MFDDGFKTFSIYEEDLVLNEPRMESEAESETRFENRKRNLSDSILPESNRFDRIETGPGKVIAHTTRRLRRLRRRSGARGHARPTGNTDLRDVPHR